MTADLGPLRSATVRICDEEGGFHGLGYRLSADLVITCAHVIAKALRTFAEADAAPIGILRIDTPFSKRAPKSTDSLTASVLPAGWFPRRPLSRADEPADLALLRLAAPLVDSLAPLSPGLSCAECDFLAYGGIGGHEALPVPIEGRVGQPLANGRYKLVTPDGDYAIEQGASGAPACDKASGTVIGLIAQAEDDPDVNAGFLISAGQIRKTLECAGVSESLPGTLAAFRDKLICCIRPFDYLLADSCQRFIDYYAGTDVEPMPFVGREKELAELDLWLRSPMPGFRLLSGPAGRGKSALLLHWAARQQAVDSNLSLLFLPISIRFETSDELRGLRLLHTQLTMLFPVLRFPPETKPDPSDYRRRICSGWGMLAEQPCRRFLLIIDGADEAASAWIALEVLPYNIAPNFAILLSARHKPGHKDGKSWLEDFHFSQALRYVEPLELPPLTAMAVGEAVVQLGRPLDALIERDQMLSELFRLTDQGDPLLVSLWVRQIWDERERVLGCSSADMKKLQPGFTGFLKVWRAEQEKLWRALGLSVHAEDLDSVLRLLAHAYAPLRNCDLYELLNRYCEPVSVRWDFEFLRIILGSASRLVVKIGEAYTFVHPRIGDHYRADSQMHKVERMIYPRAYLVWGRSIISSLNSGRLDPCQCPPYLLRHYTNHVAAAVLPPDKVLHEYLLPLLGGGWHKAWLEEEGAYGGFLVDLGRVKELLRIANSARFKPKCLMADEIRVVLIRLGIRAHFANLSPEIIVALVQGGVWPSLRGLGMAAHLPDPEKRVQAFISLAGELTGVLRLQALNQALAAAVVVEDEVLRVQMLAFLAGQLVGDQRRQVLTQALSIIAVKEKSLLLSETRAHLLIDVGKNLIEEPLLLAKAIDSGATLKSDKWRIITLVFLVSQLTGNRRQELLSQIILDIPEIVDEYDRGQVLAAIARILSDQPTLLANAFAIAGAFDDAFLRVRTFTAIAQCMAGDQRHYTLRAALNAVASISDSRRAYALAELSGLLDETSRPQVLSWCVDAIPEIADEGFRAEVLVTVAGQLSGESELLDRVLLIASHIKSEVACAQALAAIAERLSGESILLIKTHALACDIFDCQGRVKVLTALASRQIGEGRRQMLLSAMRSIDSIDSIDDDRRLAESLVSVVNQLAGESELLEQAVFLTKKIRDEASRVLVLASLAGQLVDDHELLADVLDAADAIRNERERVRALVAIAGRLGNDPALLAKALAVTIAVRDEEKRTHALVSLSGMMNGEKRQDVLDRALCSAGLIVNESARIHAFVAVAGQLDCKRRQLVLAKSIDAVQMLGDERLCKHALIDIARYLVDAPVLVARAVAIACAISSKYVSGQVLAAIASKQGEKSRKDIINRAVAIAESSSWEGDRVSVLISIVGGAIEEQRRQIIECVLSRLPGLNGRSEESLIYLSEFLVGHPVFVSEAYSMAVSYTEVKWRAQAMAAVARHMEGERQLNVFTRALSLINSIGNESDRAEGLAGVVKEPLIKSGQTAESLA